MDVCAPSPSRLIASFATFTLLLLSPAVSGQGTPPAGWTGTAPLLEARTNSCAVRLLDGTILIAGGTGVAGDLDSTEIYLLQGSFIPGPRMNSKRSGHTCTLLHDGRVLVAGGDAEGTGSAELLDPALGVWQFIAGTGEARRGHTATLLPEGQVFVAGGDGGNGPLDSIEIFDPDSTSLISSDPALMAGRSQHAAVLLADGRVMLVAGQGASGPLASTEIFDPHDYSIVVGPVLGKARAGHSAVRLDDGRVLVAGGFDGNQEIDSAEILASSEGPWIAVPHLNTARRDHLAILIPGSGGVLIAGGRQGGQPLGATEIFLPVENMFVALGPLTLARYGIAAAPIDAGVILATGGLNGDGPQAACGVLTVPAINFTKTEYHPSDTAAVSLSAFPVSVKLNFSLAIASASGTVAANDRLVTPGVTTIANSTQQFPILVTRLQDAGSTVRLTVSASSTLTAVATTQVKNTTSLTLGMPTAVYEGGNATLVAVLSRGVATGTGTMTGSLNVNESTLPPSSSTFVDGTSNTIIIGENGSSTTAVVNTTGTAVVQKSVTNLLPGTVLVSANYSGDTANDPSSTSGSFTVVSKTPVVKLTTSTVTAQAGVPFSVGATVQTTSTVPNPQPFTGSLAILQSGFSIGTAVGLSVGTTLISSATITPLTLNPILLSATYSGDSFFRQASSLGVTVNVSRAPTTLSVTTAPSTYTCGVPVTYGLTLSYPVTLGLTNRTVGIQATLQNGSVVSLGSSGLNLVPAGPKDLSAKATATMSQLLPVDISSVKLTFGGDPLLSDAGVSPAVPTLQPAPVAVSIIDALQEIPGPATLEAVVMSSSCSVPPTGSVEFLDGQNTLAVLPLQPFFSQLLPFQEDGLASTSMSSSAFLTVTRPPGVHNISVKYSGDSHYPPATSTTLPVTFQ